MKKTLVVLGLMVLIGNVSAEIIIDANVVLSPSGYSNIDYYLGVSPFPIDEYYASIAFDHNGQLLTFVDEQLTAPPHFWISNYGDPCLSGQPFHYSSPEAHVGYGDFYMSFDVDYGGDLYPEEYAYGWLKFNNSAGGLTLLNSAIAYHGSNLPAVGVIPEPSSVSLILVGSGIFYLRKKKWSQLVN